MIKFKKDKIKDLIIVQGKMFNDTRGYLREILIQDKIKQKFKVDPIQKS